MRIVLVMLALVSCRPLPEIKENLCDNGVLEPGEDCDRFSAFEGSRCNRAFCRYECDFYGRLENPATCPEGRTCGRDDLCRMPNGEYELASAPISFEATELLIADVDGDQAVDLIGGLPNRIDVRYGADGTFGESFSLSIDTPSGERTLGNLDGDPITDVIAPYLLGIDAFLGDPARHLIPAAHPQLDLRPFLEKPSVKDARFLVGQFGGRFRVMDPFVMWLDGTNLSVSYDPIETQIVQLPISGERFVTVEVDDLTEGPDTDEVIIAIEGAPNLILARLRCAENCDLDSMGPGRGTIDLSSIPLGAFGNLDSQPVHVVDLDADGRKDLFATTKTGTERHAVVLRGNGTSFDPPVEKPFSNCLPACWPLATDSFDGEALFVYPDFVLTSTGALPNIAYFNGLAPWTLAAIADFDGDGLLDLAASDGISPNVAFLYHTDDAFNRIDVALPFPPTRFAAGDYDGDGVFDLASVIDGERDDIYVIFGETSGPPSDAIFMARFPSIAQVQSTFFLAPAPWNPDRIHDLIVAVASGPNRPPTRAAILVGTGRRRMHAPIPVMSRERGFSAPHLVRAGQFVGPRDPRNADLMALTLDGRVWMLPNLPGGGDARFGNAISEVWSSNSSSGICNFEERSRPIACASLEVGQIRSDDPDEAVLVDRSSLCRALPPPIEMGLISVEERDGAMPQLRCEPLEMVTNAIGDRAALVKMKLADVNGDTMTDLILAFDDDPPLVLIAFGDGNTFSRTTEIPLPASPYDVVPVGGSQLAILTRAGLFVATLEDTEVERTDHVAVQDIDSGARIGAAQANLDGLEDLIFNSGDRVYIYNAGEGFEGDKFKEME